MEENGGREEGKVERRDGGRKGRRRDKQTEGEMKEKGGREEGWKEERRDGVM